MNTKFFVRFDVLKMTVLIRAEGENYRVIRDVKTKDNWIMFDYQHDTGAVRTYELHLYKRRNGWATNIYPVIQDETLVGIDLPVELLMLR
jgi:hypothetical protein